ncbi:hypothetical protein NHH82_28515 [Oxalobacteraceae bacterium OTU3REALA1]|nr:hypothetical protein NHH82_28515 [Oxalobacteraceae bacterium OTU3REALA1]
MAKPLGQRGVVRQAGQRCGALGAGVAREQRRFGPRQRQMVVQAQNVGAGAARGLCLGDVPAAGIDIAVVRRSPIAGHGLDQFVAIIEVGTPAVTALRTVGGLLRVVIVDDDRRRISCEEHIERVDIADGVGGQLQRLEQVARHGDFAVGIKPSGAGQRRRAEYRQQVGWLS